MYLYKNLLVRKKLKNLRKHTLNQQNLLILWLFCLFVCRGFFKVHDCNWKQSKHVRNLAKDFNVYLLSVS
jgi:hypothetical protein